MGRLDAPGALHHVMVRNQANSHLRDDADRADFMFVAALAKDGA
jgi:hypothetical protein